MAFWRNEEALMCRIFPASLRNTTLRWLDKLPPDKIDSFQKLAEQFTTCFITNRIVVKGPEALTPPEEEIKGNLERIFTEILRVVPGD